MKRGNELSEGGQEQEHSHNGDSDEALPADLIALRGLTRAMDEAVTLPLLGVKVGLDPVLGLLPGVGDGAGAYISASHVISGIRHRVPPRILLRMLLNIAFDLVLGLMPGLGDVIDVLYRHHSKNLSLILAHRDVSRPPRDVPFALKALVLVALLVPTILVAGVSISLGILFFGPFFSTLTG